MLLTTLYELIQEAAQWTVPVTIALLIGFGICFMIFQWRAGRLGEDKKLLDGRHWYSPDDVKDLMHRLGSDGRILYAWTQVSVDLVFPLIYGLLLALPIYWIYPERCARVLLLFPLAAMIADYVENLTSAVLAWTFKGKRSPLAWLCAIATASKWILVRLSALLSLVWSPFVIGSAVKSWRAKGERPS